MRLVRMACLSMTDRTAFLASLTSAFHAAHRSWTRAVGRRLRQFGVTGGAALALIAVSRANGATPGMHQIELAELIGISGSSLVRFVDQLCDAGLVERQQDDTNRRAKQVVLTSSGKVLADRLEEELHLMRRQALSHLPLADLEAAERFANAMVAAEAQL